MKKQMTAMNMGLIVFMTMVALIGIYAASRQVTTQNLPFVVESGSQVVSLNSEESNAAPEASMIGSEGRGQYRTVVASSAGAELVEWAAPRVSSLSTEAAPEVSAIGSGELAQYETVLTTGSGAEVIEWTALRVSSLARVLEGVISNEGLKQYSTVVVNPATGAELAAWTAPRVDSLTAGTVGGAGTAHYSTVAVNSATGQAEVVEWQAPKVR